MFEKKPIKKSSPWRPQSTQKKVITNSWVKKRGIKRTYTRKKLSKFKKNPGKYALRIAIYLFLIFIAISFVAWIILYNKYIKDLPSVGELQSYEFAEASTIYDRNWVELYKFFDEKRTYVEFDQINTHMINALVAWEDKRFWDNPWIDLIGISRAALYYITGITEKPEWTSTLTQQLIRNTIISNETTIERKIKEIYLAIQLTNWVKKEKILELYLNKIEFWSNAFGIEQAAKTFFDTSAKDLSILESSMLASLPKTPTGLSPYNYPDRLVWYPLIYPNGEVENEIQVLTSWVKDENLEMVNALADFILSIKGRSFEQSDNILLCSLDDSKFKNNVRIDAQWCSNKNYSDLMWFLNSIQLNIDGNIVEYQTGRKDFILGRMLEDWYITFDEYKQAIVDSFGYKFNKSKENIKAPHFVFYVKEYLEDLYGAEIVSRWGLQIYTTLDYELQKQAEEIVSNQTEINTSKYNANNWSVLTLDNQKWQIIVMVWSADYFDEENKWNVNITTSLLQPGSTFKPFVYSLATYKNAIGTKTPIYDLDTQFPNYKPQNFDGKFRGKMNFSTALNESRNIPAIKMYYLAGWEKPIVNFMKTLWVDSLNEKWQYGAPLALGTGEMTPFELARAYSVFANNGQLKEFTPILKIIDNQWNEVQNNENVENIWKQIITKWQTYLINSVLSDTSTRPIFWNTYLDLSDRKVAAKTGTSTKQFVEAWRKIIYPANLWTVWYTPNFTTVAWAWNTDGEKLNFRWSGLEWAWPIFKKVMEKVHVWEKVLNWSKPAEIKDVKISSVSWLLPSAWASENFTTNSLFLTSPTAYDRSFETIQVDALCYGKVTSKTPKAAIKDVTLVEFNSLNPNNPAWQDPVLQWAKSWKAAEIYGNITNLVTTISDKECERSSIPSKIDITTQINNWDIFVVWLNNINVSYKSSNPINSIDIMIDNVIIQSFPIEWRFNGTLNWVINLPIDYQNSQVELWIRIVDNQYVSESQNNNVYIVAKDQIDPELTITNPSSWIITLYKWTSFNLRGYVEDRSPIRTINIFIDDKTYLIWLKWPEFVAEINSDDLDLWLHTIRVEAIDYGFNKVNKNIKLRILEQ